MLTHAYMRMAQSGGYHEGFDETNGFNVMRCPGPPCVDCGGHQMIHRGHLLVATDGACRRNVLTRLQWVLV